MAFLMVSLHSKGFEGIWDNLINEKVKEEVDWGKLFFVSLERKLTHNFRD